MFKSLGMLVALDVAYALIVGEVYAKRGAWGAVSRRATEPFPYWSAIVAYTMLSAALVFVF